MIPTEFSDLLSKSGERLLHGTAHPLRGCLTDPTQRFCATPNLIDGKQAAKVLKVLEKHMLPVLTPLASPIPPETIYGMTANYSGPLPKTMHMHTAYLERRREKAFLVAQEIGLVALLSSPSFHAFASAIAGARLAKRFGRQVLCYKAGDYAGPHNDHHPEEPRAENGYIDVHVSLCNTLFSPCKGVAV